MKNTYQASKVTVSPERDVKVLEKVECIEVGQRVVQTAAQCTCKFSTPGVEISTLKYEQQSWVVAGCKWRQKMILLRLAFGNEIASTQTYELVAGMVPPPLTQHDNVMLSRVR